jgi:hypothetical protein
MQEMYGGGAVYVLGKPFVSHPVGPLPSHRANVELSQNDTLSLPKRGWLVDQKQQIIKEDGMDSDLTYLSRWPW